MFRVSFLLAFPLLALFGCRSAYIQATIQNESAQPIRLVEVDYPSASFGVGNLAAGGSFPYRFKLQGSGPIKMEFTDRAGKVHNVTGPELKEGQQGTLMIRVDPALHVQFQF